MYRPVESRGFTLLEVLIAVLIFSMGLLGMAGLLMVSVKTNQSAYLRTQASFLAQGMVDRMHANRVSLVAEDYDGDYSAATAGADPCADGSACADIVDRDTKVWSQQLVDQLPNGSANIACGGTLLGAGAQRVAAPFDGLCQIVIKWNETSLNRNSEGSTSVSAVPTTQTFAWVFQP